MGRDGRASRSPLWAKTGGGKRIRTADLLRARQTLYQLSYAPSEENFIILITRYLYGKLGIESWPRHT